MVGMSGGKRAVRPLGLAGDVLHLLRRCKKGEQKNESAREDWGVFWSMPLLIKEHSEFFKSKCPLGFAAVMHKCRQFMTDDGQFGKQPWKDKVILLDSWAAEVGHNFNAPAEPLTAEVP